MAGLLDLLFGGPAQTPADMQQRQAGIIPGTMNTPATGAPQGPGRPGEIRPGADGKNWQYVETTGMANATGSQGWIPTSMDKKPSGLSRLLAPEVALPMAAALLGGQGNAQNFGNAFGAGGQAFGQQKELLAQKAKENQTANWLRKNAPEYAQLLDSGMDTKSVLDIYAKQRYAQTGGGAFGSLHQQAEAAGLQPGTPEYQDFMLNGGGAPATFRALEMQARAAGYEPGTPDYARFMADRGKYEQGYGGRLGQNQADIANGGDAAAAVSAGNERGKREVELPVLRSKALSTMDALDQQRVVLDDDINRSIELIQSNPNMTTGLVGGLSKAVPGTPAYALAERLRTIKANIGFDKLQTMRENSPTGGALGQVSDFENRQLQAVFGSLEQAQNAEEIAYNLQRLQQILAQSKDARRRAFARDFGETAAPVGAPQAPDASGVVDYTDYFGGQ